MRQSQLFTKTRKEAPKDEVAKNAQLLIRGGYIHKEMAGVYSYLPLGFRVLEKIRNIIRDEMNCIGGQELLMTTLQDPGIWKQSGRWDDAVIDNWFKTHLHDGEHFHKGSELGIANTHEEAITNILKSHISSHRDLPLSVYQIQNKFRNELRAKSGIMRVREFIMKDMYSFSKTEEEFRDFYERAAEAYMKIYNRVGIGHITHRTFASGGSFSKFSDEFQTVCDSGEDLIYHAPDKGIAVNREVLEDSVLEELGLVRNELIERKAIEVGNIFPLGTRFSDALGLTYKDEQGKDQPIIMGCYGIGLGRLMGTIVEVLSDDKGIVWPKSVAPFTFHLVDLSGGDDRVKAYAEALYGELTKHNIETLYDDRDLRPGEKFADADLLGIPYRVVVSARNLDAGKIEVLDRALGETTLLEEKAVIALGKDLDAHATRT